MFKNYLTVALRNLLRHKIYSLINISGLAIGMACCILILLYVQDEFSHDRHHENADRIYRVLRKTHTKGTDPSYTIRTSGPLAPALKDNFPEIQRTVRIYFREDGGPWIRYGDKGFREGFCVADADILKLFTLPLVKGDPETAFKEPNAVLLTQKMAEKFFGSEDPVGKIITVEDTKVGGEFTVTGILKDIPRNSHFRLSFLAASVPPNEVIQRIREAWQTTESSLKNNTYLLLPEGYDPAELERKLPDFISRLRGQKVAEQISYHLQPITRIHLYSNVDYGVGWYGRLRLRHRPAPLQGIPQTRPPRQPHRLAGRLFHHARLASGLRLSHPHRRRNLPPGRHPRPPHRPPHRRLPVRKSRPDQPGRRPEIRITTGIGSRLKVLFLSPRLISAR